MSKSTDGLLTCLQRQSLPGILGLCLVIGGNDLVRADEQLQAAAATSQDPSGYASLSPAGQHAALVTEDVAYAPVRVYPASADGGTVIYEGPQYELTGNRVVDWWRSQSGKLKWQRTNPSVNQHWWKPTRPPRSYTAVYSPHDGHVHVYTHKFDRWEYVRPVVKSAIKHDLAAKRCLFGFITPSGCGGEGCPPTGYYNLFYSANPDYFDPRDGNVSAAQGYGSPVATPLPSNVSNTYNYSWGIPASRMTPVSHLSDR